MFILSLEVFCVNKLLQVSSRPFFLKISDKLPMLSREGIVKMSIFLKKILARYGYFVDNHNKSRRR